MKCDSQSSGGCCHSDSLHAHAGFYDAAVMDTFANEAMRRIEEFSQQNLVCQMNLPIALSFFLF